MNDALKGYLALAGGLTEVTRGKATAAAKALVAQGESGRRTGHRRSPTTSSRRARATGRPSTALVKFEVDKALGRVGLASADEVNELTARVRSLEGELREAQAAAKPAGSQAGEGRRSRPPRRPLPPRRPPLPPRRRR